MPGEAAAALAFAQEGDSVAELDQQTNCASKLEFTYKSLVCIVTCRGYYGTLVNPQT